MEPRKTFLPALDSARGVAAVMVMGYHFYGSEQCHPYAPAFLANAYQCVDFFFVLSGFVLARAYEGSLSSWRRSGDFLLLRLGRIWPLHALYVVLFLCWFLSLRRIPALEESGRAVFTLGLLHSVEGLSRWSVGYNEPSWSISAEWICYVLFALVSTVGWMRSLRRTCVYAALSLVGLVLCLATHGGDGVDSMLYANGFLRGILGFFAGALAFHLHEEWRPSSWGIGVALLAGPAAYLLNPGEGWWEFLFPFLCVPSVMALAQPGLQKGLLAWTPLVWLGTVSYSVYIGHLFWGRVMERAFAGVPPGRLNAHGIVLGKAAVTLGVAALACRFIEGPCRQAVRRWVGARAQV